MNKIVRRWFLIITAVILSWAGWAEPAALNKSIEYRDGLLSLGVRQASLKELLNSISTVAEIEINVFGPIDSARISLTITDRPLETALRSILKGYSYSVVYNAEPQRVGVWTFRPREAQARGGSGPETPVRTGTDGPDRGRLFTAGGDNRTTVEARQQRSDSDFMAPRDDGGAGPGEGAVLNTSQDEDRVRPILADSQAREVSAPDRLAAARKSRPGPEERLKSLIARYEERVASGDSDRDYERAVRLSGGAYEITHDRERIQFWQKSLERFSDQ